MVKKAVSLLLLLAAMLSALSSCGAQRPKIEDHEWRMRAVMHAEGEQLVYDAAEEESSAHPEARIVELTLVAENGKITLIDATNGKTYSGSYSVSGKNPKGTDYTVSIDGKAGNATVAMTTYADGSQEPTLPIRLGSYSLYFYANLG